MSLVYCQRWNKRLSKPIKQLAADQAEVRHGAGQPYAVASFKEALGRTDRTDRVVELALRSGHVCVYFFDKYKRVEMTYTFGPHETRLFLNSIVTYGYGDSTEYLGMSQCERIETDEYHIDGTGLHTVHDKTTGESYAQELHLKEEAELDVHFEDVPEFGQYASIARGSRGEPAIAFE
jgi:hypothetical protein